MGKNLDLYEDKSIEECKTLCSARSDCYSFEYGVKHGGSNTLYKPRICHLQSSTYKADCDGNDLNLDLYVKGKLIYVNSTSLLIVL